MYSDTMQIMPRLSAINIYKAFGATQALDSVSFDIRPGEIHALLGENGAGKSTLIKILAGDYIADKGEIFFENKQIFLHNPSDSRMLGIGVIYQEFNLVPNLSVSENMFIGNRPAVGPFKMMVDWKSMKINSRSLLKKLGEDIPIDTMVGRLPIAQQQIVEIVKALLLKPTVLIMDEPTSALNDQETEHLFKLLRSLKADGVSIIYISHRIEELFELADRVTVLRDGHTVGTVDTVSASKAQLVKMMVGRELQDMYPRRKITKGNLILDVKGLGAAGVFHDINLSVCRGEIVAIYGLLGAGQNEFAEALFGARSIQTGQIFIDGKQQKIPSPSKARACGIGLVSEDRRVSGIVPLLDVKSNISLAALSRFSFLGLINDRKERNEVVKWVKKLSIRCSNLAQKIIFLSGGNQQKAIIARWLANETKLFILNQPTRGVDVGAKIEIYQSLEDLCEQGVGVLIISIEMPEVLGIADRIYVMSNGRIAGEFTNEEATQDKLMHACCSEPDGGYAR